MKAVLIHYEAVRKQELIRRMDYSKKTRNKRILIVDDECFPYFLKIYLSSLGWDSTAST